jgi:chemotaxis receptor (MCP) glutamine deamidase CheD
MQSPSREVIVAPDKFEIVTDDAVMKADLRSAIVVCVYDAVEEAGALLHLRFVIRGSKPLDVTDTTLATELLLLDRCVEAFREAAPAARNLQAKIAAHLPEGMDAVGPCTTVLTLVSCFLTDAGATTMPPDMSVGPPRKLTFRPSMGWLNIR